MGGVGLGWGVGWGMGGVESGIGVGAVGEVCLTGVGGRAMVAGVVASVFCSPDLTSALG